MRDAVIHLITNRSGDFHHPSLATLTSYTPTARVGVEVEVRQALRLDDVETDYYAVASAMAVYAFPDILAEFGETARSVDFSMWRPDDDTIVGGEFANTNQDVFRIARMPREWPVATVWRITYVEDGARITLDNQPALLAPARAVGDYLHVEWPEELGVAGKIKLDSTWQSGSELQIYHTPPSFPYGLALQAMLAVPGAIQLIQAKGYMELYWGAQTDIERYAAAMAALADPATHNG